MRDLTQSVGCDGKKENEMNTLAQEQARSTGLLPIFSAIAMGVFLLYFTGFAEAAVFHDSAHDTRHTLAFPCH